MAKLQKKHHGKLLGELQSSVAALEKVRRRGRSFGCTLAPQAPRLDGKHLLSACLYPSDDAPPASQGVGLAQEANMDVEQIKAAQVLLTNARANLRTMVR